ncbi:MAG: autotransporter-associated beta strand repeat-containing protein, partial [Chryseolinea sp.]
MRKIFTHIQLAKNSWMPIKVFLLLFFSGLIIESSAQTRFSIASGNWNDPNVWSTTSGGAGPAAPPVTGDVVQIERGFFITVNIGTAACTSIQLGGTVGGAGSGALVFNGGSQLTVSGSVTLGNTGSTLRFGSLNMAAGGTLICQSVSSNSTTDVFTEGIGIVQLTANNTLPTNDIGNQFGAFNNLTINGGTTTLGKSISIAGTLNVNAGTLAMGANNVTSVAAITMNGTSITGSGTLTLAGDVTSSAGATLATISAPVNLGGTSRTFTVIDGAAVPDLLISGVIGGTGGIIKAGTGSMNLGASNTYSGSTTVTTGILRIALAGGAIPDASALTVSTTLDLNGNSETVGSIAGGGTITSGAVGTLTFTSGGDNTSTTFSGVIQNGTATSVAMVKNGTGTLTISGANSYTGGTTLNAGALSINNPNALGASTGTFTINGGAINNTTGGSLSTVNYPQAWNGDFTFSGTQNLNLGTGNVTLSANRQVTVAANTLTVGGLLSAGTFNLTKAGAGTLSFGNNAVTLNGLTVSAGTLVSTSGSLNIAGDLSVSGSFNHNAGTVNFNGGSTQSIAGVTYNNLVTSGAGQKNSTGSVVTVNLNNSSVFDMASNALSVSGTITNTGTIRFSGASNGLAISAGTIEYYGAAQNITAGTYNNLTINQSSGEALLSGDVVVNGTLTLASRNLNLNGFNLILGSSATAISGAPFSSSKMIIATGSSEVRKIFTAPGLFSFPIGDNTGSLEYSPIDVNVNAGTFGTPYVGVSVVDAKHPNNASSTHFLSRYWNVTNTGITNVSVTTTYVPLDINGVEASITAAQLNGTFSQATNGWIKYSALGGNTLTATNAPITSGQLSSFTGITGANPSVSITGGGVTVCLGGSVPLSASVVGGDPSILYTWTPAAGLSGTTVFNPTATPTVTTVYSVSIRDGNGILATSPTSTITVDQIPTASAAGGDQNFCGTSVTLGANVPGTGIGAWNFAPLGNPDGLPLTAFSNTGLTNSTFTGTAGQTYILRWTISNGLCTSSTDDVQIVFEPTASVSDAGLASITQCNTSTFTM